MSTCTPYNEDDESKNGYAGDELFKISYLHRNYIGPMCEPPGSR